MGKVRGRPSLTGGENLKCVGCTFKCSPTLAASYRQPLPRGKYLLIFHILREYTLEFLFDCLIRKPREKFQHNLVVQKFIIPNRIWELALPQ